MKGKKLIALLLIMAMVLASVACASDTGGSSSEASNASSESSAVSSEDSSASSESSAPESSDTGTTGDVTEIKWISVGGGTPLNYEAWLENINPYLEEKIGVNINVEVVSWGDWANRRNVLATSGEYFDILFTNDEKYTTEVNLGLYQDLTTLLQSTGSELYNFIPEDIWTAVTVDGGIYAVPAYKDSSMTNFWRYQEDLVNEYNIDITNLTTMESMTEALQTITDGTGKSALSLDNQNGLNLIPTLFDNLSSGTKVVGVKYDDESHTVVFPLDDEELLSQLDILHQWYQSGIVNADAAQVTEGEQYPQVSLAQGWPSAWLTDGYTTVQYGETILSNNTVQGSLLGIYAGSTNAEKAIELIQLVNMDSYVRDSFAYGLEGEDWDYTELNGEQRVHQVSTDWTWSSYTQGNYFNLTPLDNAETNVYETEVAVQNENAKNSTMLGFALDTSKLQTQIATVSDIWTKYSAELMTGTQEPRAYVAEMKAELEAAGLNDLIAAIQEQVDAHFAG